MNKKIKEAIERNFDSDNAEISKQVSGGFTSGILYNEDGYRIVWDLTIDKVEG